MGQQAVTFKKPWHSSFPPQSLYLCPRMNAGWFQRMPVASTDLGDKSEWNKKKAKRRNCISLFAFLHICVLSSITFRLWRFPLESENTGALKWMTTILQSALASASSRRFFLLLDQFDCQPFTTKQSALLTVGYFGDVVCKLEKAKTCFSSQFQIISELMILKNIKCCSHVFSGVSPYDECFHNRSRPLYDCYGISPGSVIVWIWVSNCQGVGVWLGLIQDIQTHISITEKCTDMDRCGKWNRSLV